MVCKGQRYQPSASHPARYAAQNHTVVQSLACRRGRQDEGLISIRASQGFQPTSFMECRCGRVLSDQFSPPTVRERIYNVKVHYTCLLARLMQVVGKHTDVACEAAFCYRGAWVSKILTL